MAEATGANIFFVKDGEVHTPDPDCFLNGLTRQTVIGMLKDRQIKVHERHIMPEELEGFEQCWLTGTAAEVTPVGQIGNFNFEVGALTREIAEGYESWCAPDSAGLETAPQPAFFSTEKKGQTTAVKRKSPYLDLCVDAVVTVNACLAVAVTGQPRLTRVAQKEEDEICEDCPLEFSSFARVESLSRKPCGKILIF